MISMEAWVTIRYLRAQGRSIKGIARELGISKNTVKRALKANKPPHYQRPPRDNPQLVKLKEQIEEMLFEKEFIGTRILKEIQQIGYTGSKSALYRFISKLKAEKGNGKAVERFETPPGHQAQFDWSAYTVMIGGKLKRVIIFSFILSYSRRKHFFASLREDQLSCFEALEDSFHHFGGVPKEILVDNAAQFVISRVGHIIKWNPRFLEFCGHYRIKPVACKVKRPKTKGKVERPFYPLEQHFIKGREFESFEEFIKKLHEYERELDYVTHSTISLRPIDRFLKESSFLIPLPETPFISTKEIFRKVTSDCLISYDGNRYSVPWPYAGKHVWIRVSQGRYLKVFSQKGVLIATHTISENKGMSIIDQKHYEGLRKRLPRTKKLLEEAFLEKFSEARSFLEGLVVQQKFNASYHLREILKLAEVYKKEDMHKAFSLAISYNTYSVNFIRGILEKEGELEEQRPTFTLRPLPRLKIKRELGFYNQFL